jgi:hypothetical protein
MDSTADELVSRCARAIPDTGNLLRDIAPPASMANGLKNRRTEAWLLQASGMGYDHDPPFLAVPHSRPDTTAPP